MRCAGSWSITPGRTVWDDYADQVKAADAKDPTALVALGDWCRDHGLGVQAKKHWTAAIAIDTDHADARKRLGFQVMIFLIVLAGLMYFTKKKVWADVH